MLCRNFSVSHPDSGENDRGQSNYETTIQLIKKKERNKSEARERYLKLLAIALVGHVRPSHTYHHARPAHKNEEFWSMRCDSLGVRQNSLMI